MKITINKIVDSYWYQPSIATISKRKWMGRPYKNLKKLLVTEQLMDLNGIIIFNGDKDLKLFAMVQQLKALPLSFKITEINKLLANGTIIKKIGKLKKTFVFDKKAIKTIKKGIMPFCSIANLQKDYKGQKYLTWRRSGWIEVSHKMMTRLEQNSSS